MCSCAVSSVFLEFLPTCVFLTFRHLDFVLSEFGLCFFLACVSCVWVPFCLTMTVSTIRNTYKDITGADKNRFWTKIKIKMIAWSPLGESVQKFCASAPIFVIHCIFSLSMTSDFWLGRWAQSFRQMWSEEYKVQGTEDKYKVLKNWTVTVVGLNRTWFFFACMHAALYWFSLVALPDRCWGGEKQA